MKSFRMLTTLVVLSLITGCNTMISRQERENAQYSPLPNDYQARIKDFMEGRLKDPYSAVYRFDTPRKGYWQNGLLYGGQKHFGFIVPVGINGKNSYGGYTGEQQFYFGLESGQVFDLTGAWGSMAGFY